MRVVEPPPDVGHRVHLEPFGDLRLVGDQEHNPCAQHVRECRGERGQKHARVRMDARQMHRAMQSHDGLAGPGGPRYARWAAVAPFDHLPLSGMQKDRPLLPRILERSAQLLLVGHDSEAALSIGMGKRIPIRGSVDRPLRRATGRQLQQRLRRLGGQMICQGEERVLVGYLLHVIQPFSGHAVVQQLGVRHIGEHAALSGDVTRHLDLTHNLANLDELRRAGVDAVRGAAVPPTDTHRRARRHSRAGDPRPSCARSCVRRDLPEPTRSSCPCPGRPDGTADPAARD